MRVLVTGSRHFRSDIHVVADVLLRVVGDASDVTLVHGASLGVDLFAALVAIKHGWTVETHEPEWFKHGKAAGPLRNQAMVDLGADVCVAFPGPSSRGTWDCVRRARAAGIPVVVVGVDT